MPKLYGLKACDTCRKAVKELEAAGKSCEFIDVRATPLDAMTLRGFAEAFGDALVNRRSTTWRSLAVTEREGTVEELISAYPTLMKRPVVVDGAVMTLGWDAVARAQHLG